MTLQTRTSWPALAIALVAVAMLRHDMSEKRNFSTTIEGALRYSTTNFYLFYPYIVQAAIRPDGEGRGSSNQKRPNLIRMQLFSCDLY